MESTTTRQFRDALSALPTDIQKRAREAYGLFRKNPRHPSLRFKKVHSTLPVYSARITLEYRAVGVIKDYVIVWFWIGSHADYERLLSSL
jgi:hypothetical protein